MANILDEIMEELKKQTALLSLILEAVDKSSANPRSRRGGMELAVELTGFSPSTIRTKINTESFPRVSAPYEDYVFDEDQIRAWQENRNKNPSTANPELNTFQRLRKRAKKTTK